MSRHLDPRALRGIAIDGLDARPLPTIIDIAEDDLADPGRLMSWQARWPDWRMVRLAGNAPISAWCSRIDRALASAGPAVLLARGAGCTHIGAWGRQRASVSRSVAAMLVTPLAMSAEDAALPFPSVLVLDRAALSPDSLARQWHSRAINAGAIGLGGADVTDPDWSHGRHIMAWLMEQAVLAERMAYCRVRL